MQNDRAQNYCRIFEGEFGVTTVTHWLGEKHNALCHFGLWGKRPF